MKPSALKANPTRSPEGDEEGEKRRSERERERGNVEGDETIQTKMNEQEVAVQISQMVQVSPAADELPTPPPMPLPRVVVVVVVLFA